jgi:hypothetical protein
MESIWLRVVQVLTLGSVAALCVCLVLLVIEPAESPSAPADQARAGAAKLLMTALEKYRSAKGAYPVLVDKPFTDLKSTLVDGGFLEKIPYVPTDALMRYVSYDGKSYGILSSKNGKPCRIEVGAKNTGWWGELTSNNLCSYD